MAGVMDGQPVNAATVNAAFMEIDTLYCNVKDHGAKGDGATNDAASIQSAISAMAAGGTLYFPPGTYLIGSGLTLSNSSLRLLGAGPSSILKASASIANLFTVTANKVFFENLQFQGFDTAENSDICIYFNAVSSCRVAKCIFSGPSDGTGFNVHLNILACTDVLVEGCYFERCVGTTSGNGYGVLASNSSSGIHVVNNTFNFIQGGVCGGRHCVYYSSGTSDSQISNNTMIYCTYQAIAINCVSTTQPQMNNIVISGNSIDNCVLNNTTVTGGIGITGYIANSTVIGNSIKSSGSCGIMIQCDQLSSNGIPQFMVIANNVLRGCATYGILALGTSQCIYLGNTIKDVSISSANTYAGLTVSDNSEAVQGAGVANYIVGNYIAQTSAAGGSMRSGIQILATAVNNIVGENFVSASNVFNSQIEDNSSSTSYLVFTPGAQSFPGAKTFSGQLIGKGTATNDSAAGGYIGEYVESKQTTQTGVPASGSWGNLTSISLTAGDWEVSGAWSIFLNGATLSTNIAPLAISVNSGATTTDHVDGINQLETSVPTASSNRSGVVGPYRLSLSATTTVYLKTTNTYTVATPQWAGILRARRVR